MHTLKPAIRLFLVGLAGGIVGSAIVVSLLLRLSPYPAGQAWAEVGTLTISGTSQTLTGDVTAARIVDSANSSYFIDPAASGTSLSLAGAASISGNLTLPNASGIRPAFGPTTLSYKSGMDAWSTGLVIQDGTGNVGVGTTTPASKLTVAGTVESTSGGFKFPDATTQTTAATGETSGQIAFFAAACPSGWTEYTAARGMYIVGNPLSGTLATAVGTALTNLENRAVGQHLHSVDPPSTGVSISDPGHTHSVTVHSHSVAGSINGYVRVPEVGNINVTSSSSTTGISASVDIAAFNSANTGSGTGTNAPYIQLTACQKD